MKKFVRAILPFKLYRLLARLYAYALAWREGPRFVSRLAWGSGEMTHRFRTLVHPFSFQIDEENRKVVLGNLIKKRSWKGPCLRMPASSSTLAAISVTARPFF